MFGRLRIKGDVLEGMMGRSVRRIRQASSNSNQKDGRIVVREVDSNLLEGPVNEKGGDRISNRLHSAHCQARTHAHHVCFRYATVDESIWVAFLIFVEKSVSDVTDKRTTDESCLAICSNFVCKRVTHFARLFDAQFSKGRFHFLFGWNTVVPVVVVLHLCYALPLDGVCNDGKRAFGFSGCREHGVDGVKIMPVDADAVPSKGLRTSPQVVRGQSPRHFVPVACHLLKSTIATKLSS